jgi:hypothetical protein
VAYSIASSPFFSRLKITVRQERHGKHVRACCGGVDTLSRLAPPKKPHKWEVEHTHKKTRFCGVDAVVYNEERKKRKKKATQHKQVPAPVKAVCRLSAHTQHKDVSLSYRHFKAKKGLRVHRSHTHTHAHLHIQRRKNQKHNKQPICMTFRGTHQSCA